MKKYMKTVKYLVLASFSSLVFFAFAQNASACLTCLPPVVLPSLPELPTHLSISCSANPASVNINDPINWVVNVSGGNESYTYDWSGTDGLSGSASRLSKSYSTSGIKTATVTVNSGILGFREKTTTCSANVIGEPVTPQPLVVSCSANPTSTTVNHSIVWTANITGGVGSYTRSWSGTDGLSGSASSVSKNYSSAGSKTATISVVSGDQTASANCSANITTVVVPPTSLVVSCYPNAGSILSGSQIGWLSNVSGGNGSYTYTWSGTDGLSGNTSSVQKTYSSTGIKTASLVVSSNGQNSTVDCTGSVNVYQQQSVSVPDYNNYNYNYNYNTNTGNCSTLDMSGCIPQGNYNYDRSYYYGYNNYYSQLNGSCSASVSNTAVGGVVNWTASASGGNGYYTYSWNGDDGVYSNGQYVSKTYYSPGVKSMTLTINSDNQTIYRTCSVNVSAPVNQVLSYVQTNKVPLTASVLLSDVPYTGAGDLAKIISFVFGIILWSLFIAYMIWRRKTTKAQKVVVSGVEISATPKDNGSKKIETFSKSIELEKQVIESVEDYARSNRVILSSDASIAIVKLAKLGKINAPELIRKMSGSDWTSIGEKDIERYI